MYLGLRFIIANGQRQLESPSHAVQTLWQMSISVQVRNRDTNQVEQSIARTANSAPALHQLALAQPRGMQGYLEVGDFRVQFLVFVQKDVQATSQPLIALALRIREPDWSACKSRNS